MITSSNLKFHDRALRSIRGLACGDAGPMTIIKMGMAPVAILAGEDSDEAERLPATH